MFTQMKKLITSGAMTGKKTPVVSYSTQTELDVTAKEEVKLSQESLQLIQYLLCKDTSEGQAQFFEIITNSYQYLLESLSLPNSKPQGALAREKYFELLFTKMQKLEAYERHTVAALVYGSLSSWKLGNTLTSNSERTILLLYLIPLSSIGQPEVIEALLDGMLLHLSGSINSKAFMLQRGLTFILPLLVQPAVRESVSTLASCVILTLILEGFRLHFLQVDEFIVVCSQFFQVFQAALQMKHSIKTIENLVVILHKLTKTGQISKEFSAALNVLHDKHLSPFCDLNLKSLLLLGQ